VDNGTVGVEEDDTTGGPDAVLVCADMTGAAAVRAGVTEPDSGPFTSPAAIFDDPAGSLAVDLDCAGVTGAGRDDVGGPDSGRLMSSEDTLPTR
jgi:hypothetical protein